MSGKFMGFSQDEINKITTKDKINALRNPRTHHQINNKRIGTSVVNLPVVATRTTNLSGQQLNKAMDRPAVVMPSKFQTVTKDESSIELNSTIDSLQDAIHFKPLPSSSSTSSPQPPNSMMNEQSMSMTTTNITSDNDDQPISESSENKNSPFKGVSLKDFESQRRMIQEQNKEKKEMLYKAIEQHSERTAAEAKKLHDIKMELQKLDSELAADVAILRKQIELASIEYMTAQQNYHKIETQFLKAKVDLHQSSEKKELLTEHLCTIISYNEDRKAKKLTELMEKVGLSSEKQ